MHRAWFDIQKGHARDGRDTRRAETTRRVRLALVRADRHRGGPGALLLEQLPVPHRPGLPPGRDRGLLPSRRHRPSLFLGVRPGGQGAALSSAPSRDHVRVHRAGPLCHDHRPAGDLRGLPPAAALGLLRYAQDVLEPVRVLYRGSAGLLLPAVLALGRRERRLAGPDPDAADIRGGRQKQEGRRGFSARARALQPPDPWTPGRVRPADLRDTPARDVQGDTDRAGRRLPPLAAVGNPDPHALQVSQLRSGWRRGWHHRAPAHLAGGAGRLRLLLLQEREILPAPQLPAGTGSHGVLLPGPLLERARLPPTGDARRGGPLRPPRLPRRQGKTCGEGPQRAPRLCDGHNGGASRPLPVRRPGIRERRRYGWRPAWRGEEGGRTTGRSGGGAGCYAAIARPTSGTRDWRASAAGRASWKPPRSRRADRHRHASRAAGPRRRCAVAKRPRPRLAPWVLGTALDQDDDREPCGK